MVSWPFAFSYPLQWLACPLSPFCVFTFLSLIFVFKGDGRMDSPGFCAQYCTYTAMDNDSKKKMSIVNLDKRETNRNSVAMEKEGFIRTIDALRKDVEVQEVCTDRHLGIKALFSKLKCYTPIPFSESCWLHIRHSVFSVLDWLCLQWLHCNVSLVGKGMYKDIGVVHCLDIWHGSKNLSKKIVAVSHWPIKNCIELHVPVSDEIICVSVLLLCPGRAAEVMFNLAPVGPRHLQSLLVLL